MKYIFKDSCIGVSIFRQAGAAPTITLVSVVDITDSTANVNVSIADGEDVSKTGVEIDTDALFSNPTTYEENGAVNTIAVDTLTAETTYYVRAYVIWNGQTIYSANSLNFTTESGSILPNELQACEWIEASGTQYIITGIVFNGDKCEIYTKCIITENPNNNQWRTLCATQKDANTRFGCIQIYRESNSTICYSPIGNLAGQTGADLSSIALNNTQEIILDIDAINNIIYARRTNIDTQNTVSDNKTFGGSCKTNVPIVLFAKNNNGTIAEYFRGKLLSYILKFDDDIVFKIYPCYVKSGKTYTDNKGNTCPAGTCGMYDVVNHVFYTNDGTGTFSKGADINI